MTSIWVVVGSLVIACLLYAACAGGYLFANRPGMALTFAGYVLANAGLIWDALS